MIYSIMIYALTFGISIWGIRGYERCINLERKTDGNEHFQVYIKKIFFVILVLLPPILLAAFRGDTVGTDYKSYEKIYNSIKMYDLKQYHIIRDLRIARVEYGYQLLTQLVYKVHDSFLLLEGLCEAIIMFFTWRGIVYYHRKFQISMPFVLFLFYMLEFSYGLNGTRFAIALAIFFYASQFLLEKKIVRYMLLCMLAYYFHQTLIVGFLLYLVNVFNHPLLKRYKNLFLGIILIVGLIFITNLDWVFEFVQNFRFIAEYVEVGYDLNNNVSFGLGIFIFIVPPLLPALLYWGNTIDQYTDAQSVLILMLVYAPLRFLAYYNEWIGRLTRIPEMLFCVGIPLLLKAMSRKSNRQLWTTYYLIWVLLYYISTIVIMKSSEVYPFTWIER